MFNIEHKYTPTDYEKTIFMKSDGFEFGDGILGISGFTLNGVKMGICSTGSNKGYDTV